MIEDLLPETHQSQNLFVNGPAGRLEAIFWTPNGGPAPFLAAVVCHPHPLYAGTMHNKVVYRAAKALDAFGIPVLRFNFRGTGLSAGTHDHGRGEVDDARAALDFLAQQFPGVPLLAAGFSFGCWTGLRAGCADDRVSELIGLGTPINNSDFSFLESCEKPKLFVQGAKDKYGDARELEALVNTLPGERRLVVVNGADHFFAGKLKELDAAIKGWIAERHGVQPG
jgi:alpha/beta superfamily hydrolase